MPAQLAVRRTRAPSELDVNVPIELARWRPGHRSAGSVSSGFRAAGTRNFQAERPEHGLHFESHNRAWKQAEAVASIARGCRHLSDARTDVLAFPSDEPALPQAWTSRLSKDRAQARFQLAPHHPQQAL
jgi:hypothetical protein